eukprot:CAMPEP_0196656756 /NCGR_PEP_ID=MMETSP1086-20130531/19421_1 /TAXON_ID=77921 /ORGANISM="Cyanoptyche  gloeocystis , Strain SAG4.97" /LENGTH=569 /DNA_ID=CAMNT_0041989621 /DNA_START=125 /DNA_END=1834 /DNA_ORIENTATION=+
MAGTGFVLAVNVPVVKPTARASISSSCPAGLKNEFVSAGVRRSSFFARPADASVAVESKSDIKFEVVNAIPLLDYKYKTQNARVENIGGTLIADAPAVYTTEYRMPGRDLDDIIYSAYRQIFGEHQMLAASKQVSLESLLRQGSITVKDFIRGLVTSEPFIATNYECMSNYRFVELIIQRVLGRDVYVPAEKVAWSIVIATQGVAGFIDAVLASDEYMSNFGDNTVPYQRNRALAGRIEGEKWFRLKTPRWDDYYRTRYTNFNAGFVGKKKVQKKPFNVINYAIPVNQKTSSDFEVVPKEYTRFAPKIVAKDVGDYIPLLAYAPSSQNWRVKSIGTELIEEPAKYNTADGTLNDPQGKQEIIYAAYRQIFSEHQFLKAFRNLRLESSFLNGKISVKGLIKGMATSEAFLAMNYEPNNNYRFVQLAFERILGRTTYSESEKVAWSIVLCNKGAIGFIEDLVESDEYREAFGDCVIPYQRNRILSGRITGEVPYNLKTPRYADSYRNSLGFPKYNKIGSQRRATPPKVVPKMGDPVLFLDIVKRISVEQMKPVGIKYIEDGWQAKVPRRGY